MSNSAKVRPRVSAGTLAWTVDEHDLGDHGHRPQGAVGIDQVVLVDGVGHRRRHRGIERHRARGEPERDEERYDQRAVGEGQQPGQPGPHQIGGDHDSTPWQPIGQEPGHRSKQQHRRHLERHDRCDTNPRAGEAKHQHHQRDRVERIARTRDRMRHKEPPKGPMPPNQSQHSRILGPAIAPNPARRWTVTSRDELANDQPGSMTPGLQLTRRYRPHNAAAIPA